MISVVKIGGNIVDNPQALATFISDFSKMQGQKILVHGGGKEATRLSQKMEVPTTMINGRRVTSAETLDIVTMVYAGLINKRIVALLQAAGTDAMGLSGADGNAIKAVKRSPIPVDYGFVGDISPEGVNISLFSSLIDVIGVVPVMCAITHDGNGGLLNCNADSVAAAIAKALATIHDVRLVYCFEQPGVMRDVNDQESIIPHITFETYQQLLADGIIYAGMMPKLENAFAALRAGVKEVVIRHASNLHIDGGTSITLS